MNGEPMRPTPKPVKREKAAPSGMKRGSPLKANRWGVSRSARGTAHSRRPREWGFMAFCHDRGCELRRDVDTQNLLGLVHVCKGPVQFAHLSDLKRYDVGDKGSGLCRDAAHQGIDGMVGGKAPWYVALGKDGQKLIRDRLANRARRAWEAFTDEQRAAWEDIAVARRRRSAP